MDERQWLRYPETGGYNHCAVEAVPGWIEMGWEKCDPPPDEPNPAVAEILAARAAQAAKQATKPAKSGAAGSDKKE